MFRLLRDPAILFINLSILLCVGLISALDPIFPLYMASQFGLSSTGIGLMFLPSTITYCLATPVFGRLSSRIGRPARATFFSSF